MSDDCVKRFCSRDDIRQEIFSGYDAPEERYQWWVNEAALYPQWNTEEKRKQWILSKDSGRCMEYFCGDDYQCMLRYIRFNGNIDIATGNVSSCINDYLQCVEASSDDIMDEILAEYILPQENETNRIQSIAGQNPLEIATNNSFNQVEQLNVFACKEALNMCQVLETNMRLVILKELYVYEQEQTDPKYPTKPSIYLEKSRDFINPRIPIYGRKRFTTELEYH